MTIQLYNGKPQKIYNTDQNKTKYVTFADIATLADTEKNNYFYFFNFFANIRVKTINSVSGEIFNYFTNLNENVQAFFNGIRLKLTNYNYDANLNKTSILNNFQTLDVECGNIQTTFLSSNTINITKINTERISSINVKSNSIFCNSLNCDYLEFKNDIGLYLYLNNIYIPINKSTLFTDLNFSDTITSIKITIKPNYTVEFYDNTGLITFRYANETNNIKYFISVNLLFFSNLKLYNRNIYI